MGGKEFKEEHQDAVCGCSDASSLVPASVPAPPPVCLSHCNASISSTDWLLRRLRGRCCASSRARAARSLSTAVPAMARVRSAAENSPRNPSLFPAAPRRPACLGAKERQRKKQKGGVG
eukprot:scaffold91867_cov30-Tisochrysis_lutea.AAC.2